MTFNKELFLQCRPVKTMVIEVPGWQDVTLRELTETDRVAFEMWLYPNGKPSQTRRQDQRPKLIVMSVINPDTMDLALVDSDIPKIRDWPAPVTAQISEIAMKCAGITDEDLTDKLKKNATSSDEITDDTCISN